MIKLSQSAGLLALRDLTYVIIFIYLFACRIQNQFTELRGSAEAAWLLIFYLWEDCGPRGNPTCLFTACFRFVLSYYGPWDRRLHSAESPAFMPRALFVSTVLHVLCSKSHTSKSNQISFICGMSGRAGLDQTRRGHAFLRRKKPRVDPGSRLRVGRRDAYTLNTFRAGCTNLNMG